jgi:hypothetical protein
VRIYATWTGITTPFPQLCESACKKAPPFRGDRHPNGDPGTEGPYRLPQFLEVEGWDAGRGDDCKDTPGVFKQGKPIKAHGLHALGLRAAAGGTW